MIIVKKEHLLTQPRPYARLTLGDMNQAQLKSIQRQFGDKFFETAKNKKKDDGVDS